MLCYDWQVGSIPLVESVGDVRNAATVLLAVVMVALCLNCVFSLQVRSRRLSVAVKTCVFFKKIKRVYHMDKHLSDWVAIYR